MKRGARIFSKVLLGAFLIHAFLKIVGILQTPDLIVSSLADPFPDDSQTSVARALRAESDIDFLTAYVSLSDPEKNELDTLLATDLFSDKLGMVLTQLIHALPEKNGSFENWLKEPLSDAPSSYRLFVLQEAANTRHVLIVHKDLCLKNKSTSAFLPSRSSSQKLSKKNAFPELPKDFKQTCDRDIVVSLQSEHQSEIKRDEVQRFAASRFHEFALSSEWPNLWKRTWIAAERLEVDWRLSATFGPRLRVIEVMSGAFDLNRFNRRRKLLAHLVTLETQGTRTSDSCALLNQFYENVSVKVEPRDLGFCSEKSEIVPARVTASWVVLPIVEGKNLPLSKDALAYLSSLRASYQFALREIAKTQEPTDFLALSSKISRQISDLEFSPLAVKLFRESTLQSDFDFEGEAIRVLKRNPASESKVLSFDRQALITTRTHLHSLLRALRGGRDESALRGSKELLLHLKVVEALERALGASP